MALEALKQYAEEQNQATRAEIERLTKNKPPESNLRPRNARGNIKPLVSKESVTEALQERLAGTYQERQEVQQRLSNLKAAYEREEAPDAKEGSRTPQKPMKIN